MARGAACVLGNHQIADLRSVDGHTRQLLILRKFRKFLKIQESLLQMLRRENWAWPRLPGRVLSQPYSEQSRRELLSILALLGHVSADSFRLVLVVRKTLESTDSVFSMGRAVD
jgi:hypothetical protein